VFDDETVGFLRAGTGQSVTPCRLESFHFLFGDAGDLQFLEDVDVQTVSERLGTELAKEQCLQFTLFLLDSEFSPQTRRHAAEEMEKLLRNNEAKAFVEGVLYAHPLPKGTSHNDALACIPEEASCARDFIETLWKDQPYITSVHQAWQAIPLRFFGSEDRQSRFRVEAVRRGLFRDLVKWRAYGGTIGTSSLPDFDNTGAVLDEWLVGLDGEDERSSQVHAAAADHPSAQPVDFSAKARNTSDPLEVAIRRQYERVWTSRRKLKVDPSSALDFSKELRRLRALQAIEAREIKRGLEANLSLPIRELNAAVALAERLLSP